MMVANNITNKEWWRIIAGLCYIVNYPSAKKLIIVVGWKLMLRSYYVTLSAEAGMASMLARSLVCWV